MNSAHPSPEAARQPTSAAGLRAASGSAAPFSDRQRVSLADWDKHAPPWDRMGDCIVVNQENGPDHCESGWIITVMAIDGTTKRLDSHWMKPNAEVSEPGDRHAANATGANPAVALH